MAIGEGYKKNFQTMLRAAKNGDLALLETTDKETGKTVMAVCMVGHENGEYVMTPVAKLFDGNPYDELVPPKVD